MLRTLAALLCCAGLACAAAPASTPAHLIAHGVTVSGVRVGALTAEPARQRIEASLLRPIQVSTPKGVTTIDPARAGAVADVDGAVTSALSAGAGRSLTAPVRYSAERAAGIVNDLAARFDRPAVDATVIGADANGPTYSPAKNGVAVDRGTMDAAIGDLLRSGARDRLTLPTTTVPPKHTAASFGPVIVITRGANTLRLYHGTHLVRTFRVATGQAIYPTPAGIWRIVDKQRDPWWYPPTYDEWAKGLEPVPPGPSNPLGTRWMGLNAPGVGIHGTDAPTSIGYSASHGCIRMQVPEAEWLFEHVRVGTPVVIL
ncbi:MAG TPA: L,D-transpeptidase family protein [Gaiellaceae bacterium]|nr:L,D-transpeptidase family protein [Gaiellaceae bacterium]